MSAGNWPTRSQEELLRAALAPPDEALAAWRRWRATGDFDTVDAGGYRLLPLIYRRLSAVAPDEPDVRVMKNVYRRAWYANQLLFKHAGDLIERLHDAGVRTLVLKGAALSAVHYRDAGARPMEDVDVLVPTDRAHDAIDVLAAAGWTSERPRAHARVAVHHAESFESAENGAVDLHWHTLFEPSDDDAFWAVAVPATIGGAQTLALAPADQLLHVCVHGRPRNVVPTFRWVADAVTIVRSSGPIDWDRMVEQAQARRVTLPLADALGYLASTWQVDVPPAALRALEASRSTPAERSAYRAAVTRPPPSPVRALAVYWERYRRLAALEPPYATPSNFRAYLRQTYDCERRWELSRKVARRAVAAGGYRAR